MTGHSNIGKGCLQVVKAFLSITMVCIHQQKVQYTACQKNIVLKSFKVLDQFYTTNLDEKITILPIALLTEKAWVRVVWNS